LAIGAAGAIAIARTGRQGGISKLADIGSLVRIAWTGNSVGSQIRRSNLSTGVGLVIVGMPSYRTNVPVFTGSRGALAGPCPPWVGRLKRVVDLGQLGYDPRGPTLGA
jgi:hypothetical protein